MSPIALIKMKSLIFDLSVNVTAWFIALFQWKVELDYWVKIFTGISAIILTWVTIYVKLKKKDKKDE